MAKETGWLRLFLLFTEQKKGQCCKLKSQIKFSNLNFIYILPNKVSYVGANGRKIGFFYQTVKCKEKCRAFGLTHVCERTVRFRGCIPGETSSGLPLNPRPMLLSHRLYLLQPPPQPHQTPSPTALPNAEKNQWFLHLLPARGYNSMWITVHKRWVTD